MMMSFDYTVEALLSQPWNQPEKVWCDKIEKSGIGTRATQSRQPRQVRKEATVTGSCVCSGNPGIWLFVSIFVGRGCAYCRGLESQVCVTGDELWLNFVAPRSPPWELMFRRAC